MTDIGNLVELDSLAKTEAKKYHKKRFAYSSIEVGKGKHFTGIVGARGIGKTVILKQIALENENSFYISLDTFNGDLFNTVHRLNREFQVSLFLLDEVHFYGNFERDLKKIYDFLDVGIIFTSSVALSMFQSIYDLSRRVILFTLYPFSFREYLYFNLNLGLNGLSFKDFYNKRWSIDYFKYSSYLEDYLKGGVMPFSLEVPKPLEILKNILEKVITTDITSVARLHVDELDKIYKMIEFIGKSPVDGINYSSLSSNIGITKYKAEQYVGLLEKSFILQRLFPKGTNVLKEPKILMCLPYRLLYSDYETAIWALREDFVVETLRSLGILPFYLKSTRGKKVPDYIIPFDGSEIVVEVGGKGKGREQFKGIKNLEKIILVHSDETKGIKYPLFMFGFVDNL